MAFRLPGDKIAVIPIQDPEYVGNIIIPDIAKQRTDQGIVKYIGPDVTDFHPGQYVIFNGYSGTVLNIQDPDRPNAPVERLIIVRQDFIYGEIIDFKRTDIPGLYFRDQEGNYFGATYEMAMELLADAIRSAPWRQFNPVTGQGINVVTPKPTREEYDHVVGG